MAKYTRKNDWLDEVKCFSLASREKENHAIYFWNGRMQKNLHYSNLTYMQLLEWVKCIMYLRDDRYAIQIIY
ncbi:MAG: hypothetical protein KQ78_01818 [Candidatus Izimaplasma bacterium HR2]|nr:MAG: hypothetical protein KQ78_01818 [Candidatus Izimaplasma bacterium HR2]